MTAYVIRHHQHEDRHARQGGQCTGKRPEELRELRSNEENQRVQAGNRSLSEETTCYVSPAYFGEEDPFADVVVHEVAHIFHNCKRHKAGLRQTRRREWLLDIEFRKRETFAYACEAYACVL